jgi:hypothetical protein
MTVSLMVVTERFALLLFFERSRFLMSIWENTILTGFIVLSLSFYSNIVKHCLQRGYDRFIPVPANQLLH